MQQTKILRHSATLCDTLRFNGNQALCVPPCCRLKPMRSRVLGLECSELQPHNATAHELQLIARGQAVEKGQKGGLATESKGPHN